MISGKIVFKIWEKRKISKYCLSISTYAASGVFWAALIANLLLKTETLSILTSSCFRLLLIIFSGRLCHLQSLNFLEVNALHVKKAEAAYASLNISIWLFPSAFSFSVTKIFNYVTPTSVFSYANRSIKSLQRLRRVF